jgi:hypothetical protein
MPTVEEQILADLANMTPEEWEELCRDADEPSATNPHELTGNGPD